MFDHQHRSLAHVYLGCSSCGSWSFHFVAFLRTKLDLRHQKTKPNIYHGCPAPAAVFDAFWGWEIYIHLFENSQVATSLSTVVFQMYLTPRNTRDVGGVTKSCTCHPMASMGMVSFPNFRLLRDRPSSFSKPSGRKF